MAAQKGREFLLKVEDSPGAGTYTTVAGLRTTSATYNNEAVDITNKDDSGFRTLLEGAGTNSVSISAEGVAKDDAALELIRVAARDNTHLECQFVVPGSTNNYTSTGEFMVESFELTGEHNNELGFSVTLQSSGQLTES